MQYCPGYTSYLAQPGDAERRWSLREVTPFLGAASRVQLALHERTQSRPRCIERHCFGFSYSVSRVSTISPTCADRSSPIPCPGLPSAGLQGTEEIPRARQRYNGDCAIHRQLWRIPENSLRWKFVECSFSLLNSNCSAEPAPGYFC